MLQGTLAPVTIPLEVSLESLLARLKQVFPGKTRLGIILGPATGETNTAQFQARAQQMGFTVRACGVHRCWTIAGGVGVAPEPGRLRVVPA